MYLITDIPTRIVTLHGNYWTPNWYARFNSFPLNNSVYLFRHYSIPLTSLMDSWWTAQFYKRYDV